MNREIRTQHDTLVVYDVERDEVIREATQDDLCELDRANETENAENLEASQS